MLSTPDTQELPDSFGHYFARATDLILTGKILDVTLEDSAAVTGFAVEEQDYTVNGLLASDMVFANMTEVIGTELAIHSCRASANNTLSVMWANHDSTQTPADTIIRLLIVDGS